MKDQEFDKMIKTAFVESEEVEADNGFSTKVIARLPKPSIKYNNMVHLVIPFSALLAASVFIFFFSGTEYILQAILEVFVLPLQYKLPTFSSVFIVGLIVWAVITLMNYDKECNFHSEY